MIRRVGDGQHVGILPGLLGNARADGVLPHRQRRQELPARATAPSTPLSPRPTSPSTIWRPANSSTSPMRCNSTTMPAASARRMSLVTVVGTNDAPVYLCGPDTEHLDRRPEPQSVRQSPRRRRSAVHRHRSVRYPHGLDHGDGDAFGRRRDSAHQCRVAGGVSTPRWVRTRPAICSAKSTGTSRLQNNAASFLNSRRDADAGLSRHRSQDPSGGSDTQDVTITILGTNHPVIITSGPQSASVSELADTTGSAAIDTTTDGAGRNAGFHRYRYRRHPYRRGDAGLRRRVAARCRQRRRPISRRRSRPRCTIPPAPAPAASTGISPLPTRIWIILPRARR